jgi:hypothetical protein
MFILYETSHWILNGGRISPFIHLQICFNSSASMKLASVPAGREVPCSSLCFFFHESHMQRNVTMHYWHPSFLFGRYRVWMSARQPAILTEILCSFPHCFCDQTSCLGWQHCWTVFGRYPVRNSIVKPNIVTEVVRDFPQSVWANAGIIPLIMLRTITYTSLPVRCNTVRCSLTCWECR